MSYNQTCECVPTQTQSVETNTKTYRVPRVNIYETPDAYALELDVPGVRKDQLTITLDKNVLTLEAVIEERPAQAYRYRETRGNRFYRQFEVGDNIQLEKIQAKLDNGVLRIHLPKTENVKPRQIVITE